MVPTGIGLAFGFWLALSEKGCNMSIDTWNTTCIYEYLLVNGMTSTGLSGGAKLVTAAGVC